jgi:endo-1,3(4)-beta-glucanase
MLPICPMSAYTRTKKFAVEEWKAHFGDDFIASDKSWTGIIRAAQAIIEPEKSYKFFSSSSFDDGYMGESDSRAYYLIYAAMLAQR